MGSTRIEVDRFDGSGDFSLWKVRMMAHFGVLGLKSILTDEKLLKNPAPTTEELEAAKKDPKMGSDGVSELDPNIDPVKFEKSEKAKDLIVLNVGNQVLRKISNCETVAAMWSTLNRLYMETSLPNRIYLQLKLYTFKMGDSKSIDESVDDFLKLVADLSNIGVDVTEEVQAILLLSSLPSKYDQLKETLKYGRDTLKLNEVTAAAKSKERELLESGEISSSQGEGLYIEARGRANNRGNKPWKGKARGRSQSRNKNSNKSDTGCFICGKEDHWKRDCPEKKTRRPTESANLAKEYEEPVMLTVSTQDTRKEWVMDSGCTFHSTWDKEVLFDLKEFNGSKVLMANNTYASIKGAGKIRIRNQDGSMVILKDVKYMPEVSRNLISYGMLEKSGCKYEGSDFMVRFYKDNKKVMTGKYHKGLYYLQGVVDKAGNKGKEIPKAELGFRKEKSKKVTFSDNLVQGPTPNGFKEKAVSHQGGESSSKRSTNSQNVEAKDSSYVAYVMAATEIDTEMAKTYEEAKKIKEDKHGKGAAKAQKIAGSRWLVGSKPRPLGAIEKQGFNARMVAKCFSKGIFVRDVKSKGSVILSTNFTSNQSDYQEEAVPEKMPQVCCDLPITA